MLKFPAINKTVRGATEAGTKSSAMRSGTLGKKYGATQRYAVLHQRESRQKLKISQAHWVPVVLRTRARHSRCTFACQGTEMPFGTALPKAHLCSQNLHFYLFLNFALECDHQYTGVHDLRRWAAPQFWQRSQSKQNANENQHGGPGCAPGRSCALDRRPK